MDGSQQNLVDSFPTILQAGYSVSLARGNPGLHYGCRAWARDVQEHCGTRSTIPRWENLYRRGLKLSSRLERLSKG